MHPYKKLPWGGGYSDSNSDQSTGPVKSGESGRPEKVYFIYNKLNFSLFRIYRRIKNENL